MRRVVEHNVIPDNSGARKARRRLYIGIIGSALFSAFVIYFVVRDLDWARAFAAMQAMDMLRVLAAMVIIGAGLFARAMRWHYLLRSKISTGRSLNLTHIAFFVNNILPFRLGDLLRIEAAAHGSDSVPRATALSVAVVERLIDLLTLIVLFVLTLATLSTIPVAVQQATVALGSVAVLGSLALVLMATVLRARTQRIIAHLAERSGLIRRARPILDNLLTGLVVLNTGRPLLLALLWNAIAWLCSATAYMLLITALFPGAPIAESLLLLVAVAFAITIPSTIASIGTIEASVILALTSQGHPYEASFAIGLVLHAVTLLSYTVLGMIGLWREALNFSLLWARIRQTAAQT